jgi:hypothetical protein
MGLDNFKVPKFFAITEANPRNGIGVKYLLDGWATPLDFAAGPATWQVRIFSTATGRIVAMETVTGEVKSFDDLDRLSTKLLNQLLANPKMIDSLSPAEKKTWGL